MSRLSAREVHVRADLDELSEALAAEVVRVIGGAISTRGDCALALSGGGTPQRLHSLLATAHAGDIAWPRLHVFFGDERYVPHDSPQSNCRMARETLLDQVPIPADNVHPIPTDGGDPDEDARSYEAAVREHRVGDVPRLDLILLGMGPDGHTASLFPGSGTLAETERLVAPSLAPVEPRRRITMTYPIINNAAAAFFLVAGEDKAPMVARALGPNTSVEEVPAAGVYPTGRLAWWLDEAAAGML